jgi:uncharacterized phage protein (TIGR01671 family)
MRTIKFRAWNGRKMIMPEDSAYYQHYISMCGNIVQKSSEGMDCFGGGDRWARAEPLELMQFTGLQDKVGVDIYEGDLIKNKSGRICLVVFNEYFARFDSYVKFDGGRHAKSHGFKNTLWKSHVTVIGNIHQNPELLGLNK